MAAPAKPRKSGSFPLWFGLAASLAFAALAWYDPKGILAGIENKWGDTMFRIRGDRKGHEKVQIVSIDEYSIGVMGPWPWKRGAHAQMIRKLTRLGVKTIAFDVFFLDPRPDDPKGDAELARATQESGRTIHLLNIERTEVQLSAGSAVVPIVNTLMPLPAVAAASSMIAHATVAAYRDKDGVMRRVSTYDWPGEAPIPVLGAAVYLHFTGRTLDALGDIPDPMWVNLRGKVVMPTNTTPTTTRGVYHFVHAADLFPVGKDGHADLKDLEHDRLTDEEKADFKDGIALIGSTAVGTYDHYPTSVSEQTPGVILHANLFDNMSTGDWLRPLPKWTTVLLVFAMVWLAVWLIQFPPWAGSSLAVAAVAGLAFADYLLFLKTWRLDFAAPAGSFSASFVSLLVQRVIAEGREKRWIKGTFGQYLSPKVVDALVADPTKLQLGGDKRDLSVFFLDIAHFTTISEKMTPENLTKFLNAYLSVFTDIILKNDGVVDKYIGDCIMAFWNAPVDQPRHRVLAALSAVECIEAIGRLNKEYVDPSIPEQPAVRIGLNAGFAVVGNMGSRTRFSYTVIGDEVNLASRLEGANKFFGSNIMASEAVYEGAKEAVEARVLGQVRVVGKAIPIRVYELLGRKGALGAEEAEALKLYNEALKYYHDRRFEEARGCFEKAALLQPFDKVLRMYINFAKDYLLVPPPPEWDGVFNLTSK